MLRDKDYIMSKMEIPQGREELCKEFEEALNLEFDKYIYAWNKVLTGTGASWLYIKPSLDGMPILKADKDSVPVFEIACKPVINHNHIDRYHLYGERALKRAVFSLRRRVSGCILETIAAAGYDIGEVDKSRAINSLEDILALEGILALKNLGIKGKLFTTKIECIIADVESSWTEMVDGDVAPEGAVIEARPDKDGNMRKGYYAEGKIGHTDYLEMGVAIEPKPVGYTVSGQNFVRHATVNCREVFSFAAVGDTGMVPDLAM